MSRNDYILNRGLSQSVRLNCQYYLLKDTLGYVVSPHVPALREDACVADVATGTGIWIMDLARSVPSTTRLDGFDISDAQFPRQIPSNVTFSVVDACEDPPADLVGQYDLVHVRLMMGSFRDNNPLPTLNHCMKLLKPGGYLQWEEYNYYAQTLLPLTPSTPTPHLHEAKRCLMEDHVTTWVATLPVILNAHGFQSVEVEHHQPEGFWAKVFTEVNLMARDDAAPRLHKTLEGAQKSRQQVKDSYEEVQAGSAITNPLLVVVGKKPQVEEGDGIGERLGESRAEGLAFEAVPVENPVEVSEKVQVEKTGENIVAECESEEEDLLTVVDRLGKDKEDLKALL